MNTLFIKLREHTKYFPGCKRIKEISQSSEQFRLDMISLKLIWALERFLWRMMTLSLSHEVFLKHFRWLVKSEEILFYPKLFWERPKGSKHLGLRAEILSRRNPKYSYRVGPTIVRPFFLPIRYRWLHSRSPPTAQPTSRLAVCFVGILAFVLIKRGLCWVGQKMMEMN